MRLCCCASARAYAAASFVTFSSRTWPLNPTGCAAPTLVPGAIAAIGHAVRMIAPADAARAPLGPTQQTTGTLGFEIALMIERIEESRPPGVSIRIRTAAALSA